MAITCPLCGRDVTNVRMKTVIAGATLPVYQCIECANMPKAKSNLFVLLPDGAKLHPDDVEKYLNERRSGTSKIKALKMLEQGD